MLPHVGKDGSSVVGLSPVLLGNVAALLAPEAANHAYWVRLYPFLIHPKR